MNMEAERIELETLLRSARAIAIEAGRQILEVYSAGYDIEHKGDLTPVTSADLAAHRLILEGLSQLPYPFPILSEESDSIPFSVRRDWQTYWLVDPLDGTREFINHSGQFTVNIALIADHLPVLGVVHAPALGYGYFAARGLGAFKVEAGCEPAPIRTRSLGRRHPVVAASHSHRGEDLRHFLSAIGDYKLVHVGGALKSCLVAEGKADLYV
ncbi:MAG: inositol monophosphatase family protein, partial [Chromatiales bacterium]